MQHLLLLWKLQSINFKAEKNASSFLQNKQGHSFKSLPYYILLTTKAKKYSKISGMKPYTNALPDLYLTTQHQSQNTN